MMYFRPKKKGCRVDFGRGRKVVIPMSNVVEVDYDQNKAAIKAITGALMIYHGNGVMNMNNREIAKLMIDKNFHQSTSFNFSKIA